MTSEQSVDHAAMHDQWQYYLAERDQLFTRSSSISVSEMATTLAHELNQPLGTITNVLIGARAQLEQPDFDIDALLSAIDLAQRQTRYAARVIARIRDFTESRRPDFQKLEVCELVGYSVQLLDWVFNAESVNVRVSSVPERALWITGDYTMLQQVITNLLRNAVDSMRTNPLSARTIDVCSTTSASGIKIEIRDHGHGLSSEASKGLFTPFRTTKPDGMGIGLNICRSFVELHQGRLWITPNESVGCTAHILFPFKTQEGIHEC